MSSRTGRVYCVFANTYLFDEICGADAVPFIKIQMNFIRGTWWGAKERTSNAVTHSFFACQLFFRVSSTQFAVLPQALRNFYSSSVNQRNVGFADEHDIYGMYPNFLFAADLMVRLVLMVRLIGRCQIGRVGLFFDVSRSVMNRSIFSLHSPYFGVLVYISIADLRDLRNSINIDKWINFKSVSSFKLKSYSNPIQRTTIKMHTKIEGRKIDIWTIRTFACLVNHTNLKHERNEFVIIIACRCYWKFSDKVVSMPMPMMMHICYINMVFWCTCTRLFDRFVLLRNYGFLSFQMK